MFRIAEQIEAATTATNAPAPSFPVEQMRKQFEKRGRHMWERLSALPKVTCVRPQGAFYCFPNVSAYFGKTAGTGGAKITDAVSFSAASAAHRSALPGMSSPVTYSQPEPRGASSSV